MEWEQFAELIGEGGTAFQISPDSRQIDDLYRYFQELLRWNAKINLVSREEHGVDLVVNHFVDSLVIPALLGHREEVLIDVGSGAGFPGLVCKIMQRQRPVILVEPRLKRVSFLRHVIRTIGLEEIDVHADRLGDRHAAILPECGCMVGRAVASCADFLTLCAPYCGPGCRVVCMKGPRFAEELQEVAARCPDWVLDEQRHYHLPISGASRVVLVFRIGDVHSHEKE